MTNKINNKRISKLRRKYKLKYNEISTELVKEIVKNKKGILRKNFKYINNRIKFDVKCKICGYENWKTNWLQIFQGQWCPECVKNKLSKLYKKDENEVRRYIENIKKGILSETWAYKGAREKFNVICKKGHSFSTQWSYIQSGSWCPECGKIKGAKKRIKYEIYGT